MNPTKLTLRVRSLAVEQDRDYETARIKHDSQRETFSSGADCGTSDGEVPREHGSASTFDRIMNTGVPTSGSRFHAQNTRNRYNLHGKIAIICTVELLQSAW